jgi:TonB family protein
MMKRLAATLVLVTAAGWGCGGDKAARRGDEGGSEFKLGKRSKRERAPADQAIEVDSELGVLETEDVEVALEGHLDDIRNCYQRAGRAQRYAQGKVVLRFMVGGSGRADDVLVIESNLGNYDVERCLVEVGRHIAFKAPEGRKATTFDYPVEFRSTNEMTVLDLDGLKVEHDLSVFMPQLAACGRLAPNDVAAIMYIEPTGFPGSVGLASEATFDEQVGDCVVQTIRKWKMSTVLPGRALRCTFSIPAVIASAEPSADSSRRRGALSASGHRRRR